MSWLGQLGRSVKTALYLGRSSLFSSRWSHGGLGRRGQTTEAKNSLEFKPTGLTQNASPKPAKPASQTGTQEGFSIICTGSLMLSLGIAAGYLFFDKAKTFNLTLGTKKHPIVLEVDEHLSQLAQAVLEDVHPQSHRQLDVNVIRHLVPITMFKDPRTLFVGVPPSFRWSDPSEVDLSQLKAHLLHLAPMLQTELKLDLEEANMDEAELRCLKEALVLSDKAKKFALGQALSFFQSYHSYALFFLTFLPVSSCLMAPFSLHSNQHNLRNYKQMKGIVLPGFLLVVLPLFVFSLLTVYYYQSAENIQRAMAKLGQDYVEGGIEYWEKLAIVGKVLRKHIRFGDYYFTEEGDLRFYRVDPTQQRPTLQANIEFYRAALAKLKGATQAAV